MFNRPPSSFKASKVNSLSRGMLFAAIGTSFEKGSARDIQPPAASPSRAFFNDGDLTWARILSHQRINLPVENVFAVSGSGLSSPDVGFLSQADQVIRAGVDYCIVGGLPNDLTRAYADVEADWLKLIRKLQDAGIVPVALTTAPRGTNSLTAAQLGGMLRMNDFMRAFADRHRNIILCDVFDLMVDQTSATSNALAGMIKTSDNLHPTTIGAFYMGKAIADAMSPHLPARRPGLSSGADIYSAANNPTGNLLFSGSANYGLMAGTNGTQSANAGLTHSGALAAGLNALRGTATSTATWDHSKENPRTDTASGSGERQVEVIAAASGGGADEIYNLRGTPLLANIAAGDLVYAECNIEVTGVPARAAALELYVLQSRPSNSYSSIDGSLNSSQAGYLPGVAWSGRLRSPPIAAQADASGWQANIRARLDASTGNAGISFKVGDFALRKVSNGALV